MGGWDDTYTDQDTRGVFLLGMSAGRDTQLVVPMWSWGA